MRNHAFIVTKPLQILIALSLLKQLRIESTTYLLIVDYFSKADLVYKRMSSMDWEFSNVSIAFFDSMKDAYKFIRREKIDLVFIDGDVGVRRYIDLARMKLRRRAMKINVYEEGVGTYRKGMYSSIKRKILAVIGAGTQFGGCRLTNALYVYNPERYTQVFEDYRKPIHRIENTLYHALIENLNEWNYVFDYSPQLVSYGSLCNVYLSSWDLDQAFLHRFARLSGDNYVKPHPHRKGIHSMDCVTLIDQTAPAELLLIDLAKRYSKINVYHHGSSVVQYISNTNIKYYLK